ncbi:AzlD domain-containing protein [Roseovarius sp. CAU 1744]|uniref:AzlD domain-containing protein n=1 Tax=Roseovarius sp. CAU 1744 TaxID=3140368 RepID=UPI00325BFB70
MTSAQWLLIVLLAIAAYGVRLAGLVGGRAISANPRLKPFLDDLPGCLVVGLVAASLAGEPAVTWAAALVALGVAILTNNVVVTMVIGLAAIILGQQLSVY